MIVLLSDKENKTEKQIIKYLTANRTQVKENTVNFISLHSQAEEIAAKTVIVTGRCKSFRKQLISKKTMAICHENNTDALRLFKSNRLSVITCGRGGKNTVSISSITDNTLLLSLQRSITDINGNIIEPCEIKVKLKDSKVGFAELATTIVLLIYGNYPQNSTFTI